MECNSIETSTASLFEYRSDMDSIDVAIENDTACRYQQRQNNVLESAAHNEHINEIQLTETKLLKCFLWIKLISCAVAVVVFALVTLVVVLFVKNQELKIGINNVQRKTDGIVNDNDDGGFCFTCTVFNNYLVGGMKVADYFDVEEKLEKCCVRDLHSFMRLLNTVVYRNVNKEIIKWRGICKRSSQSNEEQPRGDNCSFNKPSAHLVRGGQQRMKHTGDEGLSIREWFDDRDSAFRQGIGYEDGRLVIQETGNYYVYSQVYFVETFSSDATLMAPDQEAEPTLMRVWHSIYKYDEDYPTNDETMLKSTKSKCWSQSKGFGLHTSYVGAVLNLRAGDQLGIKVSNLTLVHSDTHSTYFGAYRV